MTINKKEKIRAILTSLTVLLIIINGLIVINYGINIWNFYVLIPFYIPFLIAITMRRI